jgi:hypothetical protein
MAGLVPAIHVLGPGKKGVDARDKPGHDECVGVYISFYKHSFAISPRISREFCWKRSALGSQRAQGMPGARCTRGLACQMHNRKRTRAYRFSGSSPTFPAQWF